MASSFRQNLEAACFIRPELLQRQHLLTSLTDAYTGEKNIQQVHPGTPASNATYKGSLDLCARHTAVTQSPSGIGMVSSYLDSDSHPLPLGLAVAKF